MATSDEPKTYLAYLSEAERENILRFFSDQPRSRDWGRDFDIDVYVAVSTQHHPLPPCTNEILQELWLSMSSSPYAEFYQVTRQFLQKHEIRHPNMFFRKPLEHELHLYFSCFDSRTYREEKVRQGDFWANVVSRLRELQSTEIIHARNIEIISRCLFEYGAGLRSLNIQIDVKHDELFTKAFEVVGRTLESLSLAVYAKEDYHNAPHFNISTLADLCPHVKHLWIVDLNDLHSLRNSIERLFYSYGEKLRFIGISGSERSAFLRKIGSSCPNAMFDYFGIDKSPVNPLSTLGVAIRSIFSSLQMPGYRRLSLNSEISL